MKDIESQAAQALRLLLKQVPAIKLLDIEHEAPSGLDRGVDIVANIDVSGPTACVSLRNKARWPAAPRADGIAQVA